MKVWIVEEEEVNTGYTFIHAAFATKERAEARVAELKDSIPDGEEEWTEIYCYFLEVL